MARKIVNRKELRAEVEAAERLESTTKKKTATKKKAAPRKSRKKADAEIRLKAFWGVFNQSLKRVATFEYSEKKAAEKKAQDLSGPGKSPHFVQLVKEAIDS